MGAPRGSVARDGGGGVERPRRTPPPAWSVWRASLCERVAAHLRCGMAAIGCHLFLLRIFSR
eukprot:741819-Prymnesium_polylepis.1